jgi:hypothetical protein
MDNVNQFPIKTLQPGQQFQFDLKNATQKFCECGGKYFIPVVAVYTVSALVSPTGQELTAQSPVLVCRECGKELK